MDRRLESLLSATDIGTFEWELASDRMQWNATFGKLLGVPEAPRDRGGAVFRDAIHPDDIREFDDRLRQAKEDGQLLRSRFRLRDAGTGEYRPMAIRALFSREADRVERLTGMMGPVAERDEFDGMLGGVDQRHRILFERSPVPLLILGRASGRFLMVNEAAAQLHGWSREEFEKMTPFDLIVPEQHELVRQSLARGPGVHTVGQRTVRTRNGSLLEVEVTIEATRVDGEDVLIASVMDVTARVAAERALRQSEEIFRAGFDSSPTALALLDRDGIFLRISQSFSELIRLETEELVGQSFLAFTHTAEREREWGLFEQLRAGAVQQVRVQKRYVRRDGSVIWAIASAVALTRENGEGTLFRLEVTDETELRRTMQALRASEERMAVAVDATTDGVWEWNLGTGVLLANENSARMLGYEPEELSPREETWLGLVHPDDMPALRAAIDEHAAGRAEFMDSEGRMLRKDGTWVWILERGKIVERKPDGSPLRIVGTHTDIHARKTAELELARQADLLETVLDNIPIMIVFINLDGSFEYVNRPFEHTLGYTMESMTGRDMMAQFYPDPVYRAQVMAFMATRTVEWLDWTMRRNDGQELLTAWRNVMLPDGCLLGIGQDVSEVRRIERERQELHEQLQQTQKLESLGVLAGGIAHDFNNLLVGVLGNVTMAEATLPPGAPAAPLMEEVRTAAMRAAELTRQLLAYAGKGRFVVEPVDLSTLVHEMATLLRAVVRKGTTFEMELAGDLPAVEADATQIRQTMMNLITNASDALSDKPGTITLRTGEMQMTPEFARSAVGGAPLPPGGYAWMEVEDNGQGMDTATLGRIFDPFFTTKFTGRGLGLAATLGIMRSHHGAIQVRSAPGLGTTIRIVLPALARRAKVTPPAMATISEDWRGTGEILLADDEPHVRTVARRGLERLGFTITESVDGREAVEIFAQDPARWTLVFLDLTMPRLSGEDAFREIRELRPDVPVILFSGYTVDELGPAVSSLNRMRFLQKPFTLAELGAAVRSVLKD